MKWSVEFNLKGCIFCSEPLLKIFGNIFSNGLKWITSVMFSISDSDLSPVTITMRKHNTKPPKSCPVKPLGSMSLFTVLWPVARGNLYC